MIKTIPCIIFIIYIAGCSPVTSSTRQSYKMHRQGLKHEILYAESFDDSLDYRLTFCYLDSLTVHIMELKRHTKRPISYYFATVASHNDTLLLNFRENNFPIAIPDRFIIDPIKKNISCISKRTNQQLNFIIKMI